MRRVFVAILCVGMTAPALAQTAKVEALTPSESAEAKEIAAARATLDRESEALRKKIIRTHLCSDQVYRGGGFSTPACIFGKEVKQVKPGWESGGFLFSDDYKYIVPTILNMPAYSIPGGHCWGAACIENPAIDFGNPNGPMMESH